jgi:SAM-dependent methyltransferase
MDSSPAEALVEELTFWRRVCRDYTNDPATNPHMHFKLSAISPLQPDIRDRINRGSPVDGTAKVLDVGCGPVSTIGKVANNLRADITGLDPLADEYASVFREYGLQAPHQTVKGVGEHAGSLFPEETFDYVHVENALDHCYDPGAVLAGLQRVAKPGATIFVRVFINEGEHNQYSGFHAWNFDLYDGKVVFWRPGEIHFLDEVANLPVRAWLEKARGGIEQEVRTFLHFEMLNIDMAQVGEPVGPLQAAYAGDFSALVLDARDTIDEKQQFFVHANFPTSDFYQTAFRWRPGQKRRIIYLQKDLPTDIRVGQFTVSYDRFGGRTFENTWSGVVRA